uniref:Putative glycosyltransferase n=1 Tax=viral metagenome TaxID=1070528 RepID=A0A6M3KEP3_9ZZZZ
MLSGCMIVQDEESCIARALNSLHPFVDEIVVVDGGSVDSTMQIAQSYEKVKLFEIPFARNFALQKNNALERASGDWLFLLDADEYIERYVGQSLARLISGEYGNYDAYGFNRQTFIDKWFANPANPDWQIRLFRNYVRYVHELHESPEGFKQLQLSNLSIKHYKTNAMQDKDNRLYWDMGQEPPNGWVKINDVWTYTAPGGKNG